MMIQISKKKHVSNFSHPYVIAEIGANHNGDMDLAKKMIISAQECGADCVKFQSWSPNSIASKGEYDSNQSYDDSPKKHFGSLREMVDKYYLREEQHYELKAFCDSIGIDFNSTPFTKREVDLLMDLNVNFFKVASMDINNFQLLSYIASFGLPVVISTGMATLEEISAAKRVINEAGNQNVILLHCISIYPPKYEDINLNNINMLMDVFECPVGLSDHSIGSSIPLASVALGACLIEKHFTTDKDLPGWDHEVSADPGELKIICDESKNIARALGSRSRIISEDEENKKLKFRRSVVVSRDIDKGQVLTENDLAFKRPGTGIPPSEYKALVGRTLKQSKAADDLLQWVDLL